MVDETSRNKTGSVSNRSPGVLNALTELGAFDLSFLYRIWKQNFGSICSLESRFFKLPFEAFISGKSDKRCLFKLGLPFKALSLLRSKVLPQCRSVVISHLVHKHQTAKESYSNLEPKQRFRFRTRSNRIGQSIKHIRHTGTAWGSQTGSQTSSILPSTSLSKLHFQFDFAKYVNRKRWCFIKSISRMLFSSKSFDTG